MFLGHFRPRRPHEVDIHILSNPTFPCPILSAFDSTRPPPCVLMPFKSPDTYNCLIMTHTQHQIT